MVEAELEPDPLDILEGTGVDCNGVVAGEFTRAGELLAGGVLSCGPAEITAPLPSEK